jgi:hypothetical protein
VAGGEHEGAKLRDEGGLSTRRACSECLISAEDVAILGLTSNKSTHHLFSTFCVPVLNHDLDLRLRLKLDFCVKICFQIDDDPT